MKVISLNMGQPREIFHEGRTVRRAMEVKALPGNWRDYFRDRLAKANPRSDVIQSEAKRNS
jgi:hypothetical protein